MKTGITAAAAAACMSCANAQTIQLAAARFAVSSQSMTNIDLELVSAIDPVSSITVTVFSDWDGGSTPQSLSGVLGSATISDPTREATRSLGFDETIDLSGLDEFFVLIELETAASLRTDTPFEPGRVVLSGGELGDGPTLFRTFQAPSPGSMATIALGGLLAMRRGRRGRNERGYSPDSAQIEAGA
ncbi:MAG: hypothetical protein AAFR38_01760 [Planctomycetota bacterium]